MKKKVAIWIVAILVLALIICGGVMIWKNDGTTSNTLNSGDINTEITYTTKPQNSGEVKKVLVEVDKFMQDKPLDYFNEEIMIEIPQRVGTKEMTGYAKQQSFKLDEIDTKNHTWTCTIENPENIAIESGETIFLYEQHGVGTAVDRVYNITGLKAGESIIKMDATIDTVYGEHIKLETVVYKVSVNENNEVALSEALRYQFKEMGYFPEFDVYNPELEVGEEGVHNHEH